MILELAAIAGVGIYAYRTFRLPRASTPENILVDTVIKSLHDNPFDWSERTSYDTEILSNTKLGVDLWNNTFYSPHRFRPSVINRVRISWARAGLRVVLDAKSKELALAEITKRMGNVAS